MRFIVIALTWVGNEEHSGATVWSHNFLSRAAADEVAAWLNTKEVIRQARVFTDHAEDMK